LGKSVYHTIKKKQSLLINKQMPEFSFKTNDSQERTLSSILNENYVLICFWASWCGPCKKNIPYLKTIEEKYRDRGLQMISVSIDNDPKAWLAAVEKYAMHWIQTCDIEPYINGNKVRSLYDINFIPQYFLIDKKGKLIYQNILSKENDEHLILSSMLQKLFNSE
jgi:peroxiredoxin